MLLGLGVYGTLGPDEIGAKTGRHVVRRKNIYSLGLLFSLARSTSALKSYRQITPRAR